LRIEPEGAALKNERGGYEFHVDSVNYAPKSGNEGHSPDKAASYLQSDASFVVLQSSNPVE